MSLARTANLAFYNMSADYKFVYYKDIASLHDASTTTQIRKHAMQRVGATRRRPRGRRRGEVELSWVLTAPPIASALAQQAHTHRDSKQLAAILPMQNRQIVDDKALYDAFIRSLSCKADPFGTASVSIDATARRLLEYFVSCASRYPNTWTYSSSPLLPSTPNGHRESISRTVSLALQDTLIGNCLLATAASRLYYADQDPQLWLKRKELSLTQEALRLFQTRLDELSAEHADSVEALVTSALHLGGAAFYKGDVATAGLHIRAAVTLAKRIDGVSVLRDPYVRGRIISFDDLISCIELRACLVEDTYDPGPPPLVSFSTDPPFLINAELIGSALLLKNSSALPLALQELVLQILQCYWARCEILGPGSSRAFETLAIRQWLTMRTLAVRNRLLALNTADRRTDIVRVALLMWTLLPLSDMRHATIINAIAPKLQSMLKQVPLIDWTGCEDIYLWCLLMGYTCAQEGSDFQIWFAGKVQSQLESKSVQLPVEYGLFKGFIAFQKRYLYYEPVQEAITKKLTDWLLRGH